MKCSELCARVRAGSRTSARFADGGSMKLLIALNFPSGFMPHGTCYLWSPQLISLHVASDLVIALSYLSIPVTLVYFTRKRNDIPFSWMLLCFGTFIVACGATHLMEVWTVWHPTYWLAGGVKAVTAAVSIASAILLVWLTPRALALPGLQKQTEDVRRHSELQFRTLAEAIPQLCWMANADGWIFWYNQRWYTYTGTTPDQMEGWGWKSVHDPRTLPAVLEQWNLSIASGYPFDMIFPLRGADGIFRPFLTRVMPFKDSEGKIVQWFGTNTDVTELRDAQEALRASEERLRLAQQAAGIGAFEWNTQTGAIEWSQEMEPIYGLDAGGLGRSQKAFESRIHPADRAGVFRLVESALQSGQPTEAEWRVVRPDDSIRWIAGRWQALKEESGKSFRLTGVCIDITDRKRADAEIRKLNAELEHRVEERTAQLAAANRDLESFTYSVSHDLRAPLRHIDGFSRILVEEYGSQLPAGARQHLDRVRGATRHMGQLVDDLLNLARVGRVSLRIVPTDLNELVADVLLSLEAETRGRIVDWKVGRLSQAPCDSGLMRQVFFNLLANALKFTRQRERAVIEIGEFKAEGTTVLFVRDNGVGFDLKYADKLFQAFQRMHSQEEFEGTGVGLAIVHRILQIHRGEIRAESSPQKGATFLFSIAQPLPASGAAMELSGGVA